VKQRSSALGAMSVEHFFKEYWQKKPLLIRQGLPDFNNPLSIDEIAGFACDELIESRLIIETSEPSGWQVQDGPFESSTLHALPDSHWTLHVQSVDHYVPDVYNLLDHFRFIPNWRIDDVMVSCSSDSGTAGPHYDQYDVFLIQGLGNKLWKIGQKCDQQTALLPDTELSILKDFQTTEEWLVKPGDILYIPPQYAHYGIAQGQSITYSIGFRAPGHGEILSEFSYFQEQRSNAHQRYQDPDLTVQNNPGELSEQFIDKVQSILREQVNDRSSIAEWLGEFVTREKIETEEILPEQPLTVEQLLPLIQASNEFCWSEGARFAYIQKNESIYFYVNGNRFKVEPAALRCIQRLCCSTRIKANELLPFLKDTNCATMLCQLYNNGFCYYS
jgi:50S ribosomal protein L16 3-hydroxylase